MQRMKILAVAFFVMMFGLCLPAAAGGRKDFNYANHRGKVSAIMLKAEARRVTANELRGSKKVSAFPRSVQANGGPIAPWPYADFMRVGIEDGHMLYLVSGDTQFLPEDFIRVYVDGRLTDKKFKAQEYAVADPNSPHELYTFGVTEFTTVVRVPATLGAHSIELQVPWRDGNWFPLLFEDFFEPEATFLGSCATQGATDDGDEVTSYLAYVTLDGKFPAAPLFFVNDVKVVPTKPLVYEAINEYINVVAVTYSAKNYEEIRKSAEESEELRFRIEGVADEITFEWNEYWDLPPFDELENCNACYDEHTGEEVPCPETPIR